MHTITGRENKTCEKLRLRIAMLDLEDEVLEIYAPMHEEMEMRSGSKRTVKRNIYPGYILVKMVMSEEAWHAVRQTPGVTGFISAQSEGETRPVPVPLDDQEAERIKRMAGAGEVLAKTGFKLGDRVRINGGPFQDFLGIIKEINEENTKLRVQVSFLGRETPVELDFLQVEEA